MSVVIFVIAVAALATSALLTWMVRNAALSSGILDKPNARSSHSVPTPRGGGLSIVLAVTSALIVLTALGHVDFHLCIALGGGGLAVAAVGFADDRKPLSARLRLLVHFGAALWALVWLGGLPPLRFGPHVFVLGWGGYALGALGIVWTLNLFNFMDGIDGIAASEAVFVTWCGAFLALSSGGSTEIAAVAIVFGAACSGFLFWNWPAAKVFMGDVGSGYIGFAVAVLAVAATRADPAALLTWLLLGGIFFTDATITFLRRLIQGERVMDAHRSHAYQWLARKWGSHRRVTVLTIVINFTWLLPWAVIGTEYPEFLGWIALVALSPLAVLTVAAGAGRSET